jgi:hypothetical protein
MLSNSWKAAALSCSLFAGLNGCGDPASSSDGEKAVSEPGTSKVHQEIKRFPVEIVLESGEVKPYSLPFPSAVLGQAGSTGTTVTDSIRYTQRTPNFVIRPLPGTRLPDEVKDFIARNAVHKPTAPQAALPRGEAAHGSPIVESSQAVPAHIGPAGAHLMGGRTLDGGYNGPEWLVSPNGRYKFVMQRDTNFVHYDGISPTWATDTAYGEKSSWVTMQGDGNLVLYELIVFWDPEGGPTPINWPHWSTGTYGNPGAWFYCQSDGNSVVYAANNVTPLWSVWHGAY